MAFSRGGWTAVAVFNSARLSSEQPFIDPNFTAFRLRSAPSRIHGWGVFAEEAIPAGRKVIEYGGERINRAEAKKRMKRPLHFIFNLDDYWSIDGASGGSGAQSINHCCDPNLRAWICRGHILFMSKRLIEPGEELTLDYKFRKGNLKHVCYCGAPNCRGSIEVT
jgi:SET domain-containing protein